MVRTVDSVVADLLHEQMHWHLVASRGATRRAMGATRRLFKRVPTRRGGGDRTRRSTRLHLIINLLEADALATAIGPERAYATTLAKAEGVIYPWVYRQVLDHGPAIRSIVESNGLAVEVE